MNTEKRIKTGRLRIESGVWLTVFGTLLLAFGSAVFILPFELVTGGMTGLSLVLEAAIPLAFFTAERILMLLTWGLFLLGAFSFGKQFAAKTLISSFLYPTGIAFFSRLAVGEAGGAFRLLPFAAALLGGVLVGAGCALTFLGGGSTGGTDILAFLICRGFPRAKSPRVIFLVDAAIILLGALVIRDPTLTLLGIFSAFVSAAVIEGIFLCAAHGAEK